MTRKSNGHHWGLTALGWGLAGTWVTANLLTAVGSFQNAPPVSCQTSDIAAGMIAVEQGNSQVSYAFTGLGILVGAAMKQQFEPCFQREATTHRLRPQTLTHP